MTTVIALEADIVSVSFFLYNTTVNSYFTPNLLAAGDWYNVSMQFTSNALRVVIIGEGSSCSPLQCIVTAILPPEFSSLFSGELIVGGLANYAMVTDELRAQLPTSMSFGGCLRDVQLDGAALSIDSQLQVPGSIPPSPGCPRDNACLVNPCANAGTCISSWLGYTCNCALDYSGVNCTQGIIDTPLYFFISISSYSDASVTLTGADSYVTLQINPQLEQFRATGSLSFRTADSAGILLHFSWNYPQSPGLFLTIEITNSQLLLLSTGMFPAH